VRCGEEWCARLAGGKMVRAAYKMQRWRRHFRHTLRLHSEHLNLYDHMANPQLAQL